MKKRGIKILFLEDDPEDVEIAVHELKKEGIDPIYKRVQGREDFLKEIGDFDPEIILSDYTLPQFTALEAIDIYKEKKPEIPFILLTGTQSEQAAVEVMKRGISDYILKSGLARLPSAIRNALEKKAERDAKERTFLLLKQSEERLKAVLKNTPIVLFSLNTEGSITLAEGKGLALLDLKADELLGKNAFVIFSDVPAIERHIKEALSGKTLSPTIEVRSRFFSCFLTPDYDINRVVQGIVGVSTDVTEQTLAHKRITHAHEELKKVNQTKSEFISIMSHELRTPLNTIREGINLVLDGVDGPVTKDQDETLSIAKSNVDRMVRLVNNVLDFTRFELGKMQMRFEPVELCALAREVQNLMSLSLNRKHIKLTLDLPTHALTACCDAEKMKQVLVNLLDNAVKFTPEKGSIGLEILKQHGKVIMEISDTGPGIAKDEQDRIFEMFLQGSRHGMSLGGGSGVGLALAKQIVDQHHGIIKVTSRPKEGSTFTISFPDNLPPTL